MRTCLVPMMATLRTPIHVSYIQSANLSIANAMALACYYPVAVFMHSDIGYLSQDYNIHNYDSVLEHGIEP